MQCEIESEKFYNGKKSSDLSSKQLAEVFAKDKNVAILKDESDKVFKQLTKEQTNEDVKRGRE